MHFILSGPHTSLPPSLIYETTKYRNMDKDKKKRWSIQCSTLATVSLACGQQT